MIFGSTSTARPVLAARASTPPTRRSGSPTCRPAPWCRARTSDPNYRTGNRRCACCAARLTALAEEQAADAASAARRSQVRTVDRSERIRTYNFPENRIADHRIGFKAYNLDQVLNGALAPVITALLEADIAERLAAVGSA